MTIATVVKKSMPVEIRVIGTATAHSTVDVHPQVAGRQFGPTARPSRRSGTGSPSSSPLHWRRGRWDALPQQAYEGRRSTVTLGPIVVNQRDDIVSEPRTVNGKTIFNFHVAGGVFFVDDGKIVEWTDYFFL